MSPSRLHLIGSFQEGKVVRCEDPTEQAWLFLRLNGSPQFLAERFRTDCSETERLRLIRYATARVRQAHEFRMSSIDLSLLTRPLLLYYSALNLMRALLVLKWEVESPRAHGLKFIGAANLMEARAELQNGTFREYITRCAPGIDDSPLSISLEDALNRIPELASDYAYAFDRHTDVYRVTVEAFHDGYILLNFPNSLENFREEWSDMFPKLSGSMTLLEEGNRLETVIDASGSANDLYARVAQFCRAHLVSDLQWQGANPHWYAIRKPDSAPDLPREAYYHVALFILGSSVRYEPESLLELPAKEARQEWLAERILRLADRYFPQLMLERLHDLPIFLVPS